MTTIQTTLQQDLGSLAADLVSAGNHEGAALVTTAVNALEIQTMESATRPDILEKLTYHRHERDDMTLDDCLEYLANRWKKIHGRPERALIMQITELLASAPQQAVAASSEPTQSEIDEIIEVMIDIFPKTPACNTALQMLRDLRESLASTNQPVQAKQPKPDLIDGILRFASMADAAICGDHNHLRNIMKDIANGLTELLADDGQVQPVQAKALTDEQIEQLARKYLSTQGPMPGQRSYKFHRIELCQFSRILLASQPSAQADVAAVRHIMESLNERLSKHMHTQRTKSMKEAMYWMDQYKVLCQDVFAELTNALDAAPTAQPQVDMSTCNHIFIAVPIGDRYAANAPFKAVCKYCGYEPQAYGVKP